MTSVAIKTTGARTVAVAAGGAATGSIVVKRMAGSTLESLSNVNASDLQDGYTIVYDTDTNKWVAQPASTAVASVDGGTY